MSAKEFAKIAVALREHPKVLQAGDDAGWLFVCAILWSKEHDTDGLIPEYVVPRLNGLAGRRLTTALEACVDAGLLESADDGWRIHDYLDHQESAERRKAAGKKAADTRWERERNARRTGDASESHANRIGNALRNRNTEEEEEKEEEAPLTPRGGRTRDREAYEQNLRRFVTDYFPAGVEPGLVAHFASQLRGRGVTPTVTALRTVIHDFENGAAA